MPSPTAARLVTVPDVIGLPYELAAPRLKARGLRPVFRQVHETGPEGVLRWIPSTPRLPRGTTVTLIFADATEPSDIANSIPNKPASTITQPARPTNTHAPAPTASPHPTQPTSIPVAHSQPPSDPATPRQPADTPSR